MEVLVVGSLMIDLITYADRLPRTGETVFGTSFQQSFGGKGANQAVQCARLGVSTSMLGMIGSDNYGTEYKQQLIAEAVNVSLLGSSEASGSGKAIIQVDAAGQNTIIIVQGANLDLSARLVAAQAAAIATANVVLCQNEVPFETTKQALLLCREHGTVSVLNPAPASANMLELVPLCDIFSPNETELSALTGLPVDTDAQIQAAAEKLLVLGCKAVVVTLGARGACLVRPGKFQVFPTVHPVVAVDTVGAGDSFIGALAANIARGVSLEDAIPRAVLCASLSVTRKGAQCSCPTREELLQLSLSDGSSGAAHAPPGLAEGGKVDKETVRAVLQM